MSTGTPRPAAVPFWQRLDEIALYPLRIDILPSLIILALCSLLGLLPLIGGLLTFLVWLIAYKFGFDILRASADGHADAPDNVLGVADATIWRFLGMELLYIVAILLALALGGPWMAVLVLALVACLQPGSIISLAIDEQLLHALNPFTALNVFARLGWPYLVASLLLFASQIASVVAGNWITGALPALVAVPLQSLILFWGLIAAFHLMGSLVYQYHRELGYEPANHALTEQSHPDRQLADSVEIMTRDGDVAGAVALLRGEVQSRAVDIDIHEMYRRLLLQTGDHDAALAHAGVLLNLLMANKQERRALALLRESLAADPDFVPLQFEHGDALVERARQSGQPRLAADALQALLRAYPKHPDAPRRGLDAALLLVEHFDRDQDARQLLQQARARNSDPQLETRIDAALAAIPPATH